MCCATGAGGDWDRLAALREEHPQTILASYGLHPWWIDGAPADWKKQLEARLDEHCAGIGEIGLDKGRRCVVPLAQQTAVFSWQLDLARERHLPASIHCVHTWDELFRILRGREGQRLLVHGFGASGQIARELARRGVHLSLGGKLLGMSQDRAQAILSEIPTDLLHFESDFPGPPSAPAPTLEPCGVPLVVECAARLLKKDEASFGTETAAVSEAFFSTTIPS